MRHGHLRDQYKFLGQDARRPTGPPGTRRTPDHAARCLGAAPGKHRRRWGHDMPMIRSEEHTSELQSLMRISYAVFCLKKKQETHQYTTVMQYTHINAHGKEIQK